MVQTVLLTDGHQHRLVRMIRHPFLSFNLGLELNYVHMIDIDLSDREDGNRPEFLKNVL